MDSTSYLDSQFPTDCSPQSKNNPESSQFNGVYQIFGITDPLDPLQNVVSFLSGSSIYRTFNSETLINIAIVWLFIEVLFFVMIELTLLPRLRKKKKPIPYNMDRLTMINRILDDMMKLNSYSKEYWVRGWFFEAEIEDIYSENVRSFLSWVLYGESEDCLNDDERNIITQSYDIVCSRCGFYFKPGFNPKVRHVAISWDDVEHIHRPLILYIGSYFVDFLVILLAFRLQGYRSYELYGINYWYHPGSHDGKDKTPMIFLHGITPGWAAYIQTIRNIKHGRPVFLVELNGIKVTSLEFNMPTPEAFANTVRHMLERHHYQTASIVGHSFGSISAAWILKHHPDIVSHVTLIDPVSLLLFLPDVAYRFVYRSPKTIIEKVIYAYARSELTISYMLARNFYWYRNFIWLEDVPAHIGIVVSIAGCDEISDAKAVHEYVSNFRESRMSDKSIKAAPVEVMLRPNHFHGQIMIDGREQHVLGKTILHNEKNSFVESPVIHSAPKKSYRRTKKY